MQPNAPPAPPPYNPQPVEKNPYDFLMNPDEPKKSLLPSGNSKKQRMLIVGAGALIVLMLIALIGSFIFGGKPSNSAELLALAKQQNELIRISDIGVQKSRDAQAKDLAQTAKLALTTDQQPLLTALKAQKITVSSKQLAASKNPKNDDILTQAEQANNFDEVFIKTLQEQLTTYQKALKTAYDNPATGKKLKATLAIQYKNASLIINAQSEL